MTNVLKKTLIAGAAAASVAAGVAVVPTSADARPFGYGGGWHGGFGGWHGGWGRGYGARGFYGPRVGFGYGRGFYGPGIRVGVGPGYYGPRWGGYYGRGWGYRGPYSYRAIF